MLRKVLVIVAVTVISVSFLSGCKKRSSGSKTTAEYEAEAKQQVNKENMAEELDNIEKALGKEISQEQ